MKEGAALWDESAGHLLASRDGAAAVVTDVDHQSADVRVRELLHRLVEDRQGVRVRKRLYTQIADPTVEDLRPQPLNRDRRPGERLLDRVGHALALERDGDGR